MSIITQTPRMIIREFQPDELDVYLNHFKDERVTLHIPKRTRDERTTIFNIARNQYNDTKTRGIWGMFDAGTGDFIGSCLLRPFNEKQDIMELGYSMEQRYWGQGFGTEMAVAIIERGFSDTKVSEIVAVTTFENHASQRVLAKAGLVRDGNLRRGDEDLAFFSLKR
ncbi:GNAT family N-acetyltransferase [Mucilaginibacter panaciglaebae]|uniref:GNAT family protein n=1 Tax=Mucilaginibacter panaciglaebae TaxID=502331 RepID=A0ABP7WGX8_9SPHI